MARSSAAERAARLVAVLGLLRPNSRIPIAQLADDLGCTAAELAGDLETLSMCGVAPFTPDMYVPVFVEDGYVEVMGELPAIEGPIRLSVAEATALAAALQAAGFDSADPLTARLLDATAAPSFSASELEMLVRTASASHAAGVYETLAKAVGDAEVVRIEYSRPGDDPAGLRDVEPQVLFAERGAWYLTGFCRKAGDWRTFRLDRIRSVTPTGEILALAADGRIAGAPEAFAAQGLPTAHLRFGPDETFSDRDWPGARVVETAVDGSVMAEVPYGGTDWIARHVVARLGRVEVLDPPHVREAVRSLAQRLSAAQ